MAEALPRPDHRHQVRRQRDGERRAAGRVRRTTSPTCATSASSPSSCTAAARRSRRCSTGSRSRASSRAATGSPAPRRSASCAWCSPARSTRSWSPRSTRTVRIATGLSGEDAGLFGGRRRGVVVDGVEHDLGRVGDVVEVDPQPVLDQLAAGRIPVVSSIAPDLDHPGHSLNVNADAAAAALAIALGAAKLVVLTDVAGLYADWPNRDSLVSHLTAAELRAMLPSLESGMIPKMQACLDAVEGGVETAAIIDGRRAALGARGDLHQQGNRNGSGARMTLARRCGTRPACATFGDRLAMFVRGEGAYVWDADGRRYLDFLAGIAVNSLGHAHPVFVEAIATAGGDPRARVELLRDPAAARARRAAQAPRRHGRVRPRVLRQLRRRGERGRVQARPPARRRTSARASSRSTDAFHGRTMGTLALTGKPYMQEPFLPMVPRRRVHRLDDRGARSRARRPGRRARSSSRSRARPACVDLPEGYLQAARALTERARRAADRRRDPDRRRPHRRVVRLPARRHHARRDHGRQGHRRRVPDRRAHHLRRGERPVLPRHARLDVRRQPARRPPSPTPCSARSRTSGLVAQRRRARCAAARGDRRDRLAARRRDAAARACSSASALRHPVAQRGRRRRAGARTHRQRRRTTTTIRLAPRAHHRRRRDRRVHRSCSPRSLRDRPATRLDAPTEVSA